MTRQLTEWEIQTICHKYGMDPRVKEQRVVALFREALQVHVTEGRHDYSVISTLVPQAPDQEAMLRQHLRAAKTVAPGVSSEEFIRQAEARVTDGPPKIDFIDACRQVAGEILADEQRKREEARSTDPRRIDPETVLQRIIHDPDFKVVAEIWGAVRQGGRR